MVLSRDPGVLVIPIPTVFVISIKLTLLCLEHRLQARESKWQELGFRGQKYERSAMLTFTCRLFVQCMDTRSPFAFIHSMMLFRRTYVLTAVQTVIS